MSFNLKDISKKAKTKQSNIKECYRYIINNKLITTNLQIALKKYINFRCKNRQNKLTANKLDSLFIDLLVNVCNKKYEDITEEDILIFESELLYQIKRAIYFGAVNKLYYEESSYEKLNSPILHIDLSVPKNSSGNRVLYPEQVKDYFEDLMI